MAYHINPETGNANICRAVKQCRFGSATDHFKSREEAQAYYELQQPAYALTGASKGKGGATKPEPSVAQPRLKTTKQARPVWGTPCPNPKCKTTFHDLRSEHKINDCINAVASAMEDDEWDAWSKAYKSHSQSFLETQKKEVTLLLDRYHALPASYRTLAREAASLEAVKQAQRPQWYTEDMERIGKRVKLAEAKPMVAEEPKANPNGYEDKAYLDAMLTSNSNQLQASIAARAERIKKTSAGAGELPPVAPPPLTAADLRESSLSQLYAIGEREKALSTKKETKTVKRRFRRAESVTVEVKDYTDNYKAHSDFVAILPPKTLAVYSLYETARANKRLNQPEVLAHLEEKFTAAKAEEKDLFVKDATALDEIKSLLAEQEL